MGTMITAHSGSDGTPDNSMAYLRYALSSPADAFEVDVHTDRHGTFYLSHDSQEGTCPSLCEAFTLLGSSRKKINCDLKESGMERAVLALAEECGVRDRVILTGEVSPELLQKDAAVRAHTFLNLECAVPELAERYALGAMPTAAEAAAAVQTCRRCGVRVVNVYYPVCTPENLAAFREWGIGVSAWTVNDRREALRLLDAGVVNLTTRAPTLLCQLRESRKP